MGTQERLGVNIHVDQLMDGIANNCANLERLELRWDPENLRFSDKSQKAIDILRVKCLKLKALGLRSEPRNLITLIAFELHFYLHFCLKSSQF